MSDTEKTITQADIEALIWDAWAEATQQLADMAFPRESKPTLDELRAAHAHVAGRHVWRIIREIVCADDSVTYQIPDRVKR